MGEHHPLNVADPYLLLPYEVILDSFARIHPFLNGNGRWSRMLANIWLKRNRRRGYLIAKLDARKLGRKPKPFSMAPQPESTEQTKQKKWLSLKNEALWSQ